MNEFDKHELMRLDVPLLVIFLALVRHRKAAMVANELSVTPSTVSHALQRLRDIFDDPLFLRKPHGLEPTAFALDLEPLIRQAVETLDKALEGPSAFDPGVSHAVLRIAGYDLELSTLLPSVMERLSAEAPGIRIIATASGRQDAVDALNRGDLDLALGFFPETPGSTFARELYEERFVVVAKPGAFDGEEISLDAYTARRHLVVSPGGDLSGVVDIALEKRGLTRNVVLSVPLFLPALASVKVAGLVATLPERIARGFASDLGLVVHRAPLAVRSFQVSALCHRRNLRNPMINWFSDVLSSCADELISDRA